MEVFESADTWTAKFGGGQSINWAMIPTMGALHQGHLSLIEAAQKNGYQTVVSIFVNPLQFNNAVDLEKYPRHLENDLALLVGVGVDAVWTPNIETIYPSNFTEITLDLGILDQIYEGLHRPGHFNGVIQVLNRLFSVIQPQAVFFGQKDLQQCLVVEKLLASYFPEIRYFRVSTLRAESGLALSSRNERLSLKGKEVAAQIYASMLQISKSLENSEAVKDWECERLKQLGFEIEYLDWVNLPTMEKAKAHSLNIAEVDVAAFQDPNVANNSNTVDTAVVFAGSLEGVRLIDNLLIPASLIRW
ncbi:pantothenate synthetase [Bacteroidota bacterium]|nr:pantothenate synthetase [Bacteroidota bacterium]